MCFRMGTSCWHWSIRHSACCSLIIVYTLIPSATGITLSTSGSDNTLELVEASGDNTVTCRGFPDDYNVDWIVKLPTRTFNGGNCPDPSTPCTNRSIFGFIATRPSADTSTLIIDPRVRVDLVRNGTLECQATKLGEPDQIKSWQLDIVSPPSSVTCTVQLDTSDSLVIGRCNVTKVYSYNGRYSCQWYSTEGSAAETNVTSPVDIQTAPTADVTPTGGQYVNVMFTVTMNRTQTVDTSYRVVIRPGSVNEGPWEIKAIIIAIITALSVGDTVGIVVGCCSGAVVLTFAGYASYVGVCWIISKEYRKKNQAEEHSTPAEQTPQGGQHLQGGDRLPRSQPLQGEHPPPGWHVHYLFGMKIQYIYLKQGCVRNGCTVLIFSRSPTTNKFRFFGTEDGPSGPRKVKNVEATREITTVGTIFPPPAVASHGKIYPLSTPPAGNQSTVTSRLRPLPAPKMPSVERNSTAESSNVPGLGKQSEPLPPIGKQS